MMWQHYVIITHDWNQNVQAGDLVSGTHRDLSSLKLRTRDVTRPLRHFKVNYSIPAFV
jgi:hypothetical protein